MINVLAVRWAMQLGISFRRALLILLSVWTVLFFVSQFLSTPPPVQPVCNWWSLCFTYLLQSPSSPSPNSMHFNSLYTHQENPPKCDKVPIKGELPIVPKVIYEDPFPKELSFILLNWNRTHCLKTIVEHAQVYSAFITEIVIGNNNPAVTLLPEVYLVHVCCFVNILYFHKNIYIFFYKQYQEIF